MASISRQSNRRVQQPGILDYAVIDWQIQQRKDRVSAARYSMQQASKAVGATAPAVNHWACGVLQQATYWLFQGCALYQSEVVEIYSQVHAIF